MVLRDGVAGTPGGAAEPAPAAQVDGGTVTGPLANEFAQVREALSMWLRGEPPQTAIGMGHGEVAAALARIEEHTHNTEKRIGWAIEEWLDAQGYNPLDSDAIAREILARAVLSAGEGTPA